MLSATAGIYNPIGQESPVTIRMKLILRSLLLKKKNITWDEPVPEEVLPEWHEIVKDLVVGDQPVLPRCLRPQKAVGPPEVVCFSDGSSVAYVVTLSLLESGGG